MWYVQAEPKSQGCYCVARIEKKSHFMSLTTIDSINATIICANMQIQNRNMPAVENEEFFYTYKNLLWRPWSSAKLRKLVRIKFHGEGANYFIYLQMVQCHSSWNNIIKYWMNLSTIKCATRLSLKKKNKKKTVGLAHD